MLSRDSDGNLFFPIRSNPDRFLYAGHLPNGTQLLLGHTLEGEILAVIFDGGGNLLEIRRWELPRYTFKPNADIDESQLANYLDRELRLTQDMIRIKAFRVPDELELYHLPKHFVDFLSNPNDPSFDDEERAAYPELIRQWHDLGQFVLEWGNDYWLDETGEIVTS